MTEVSLDVIKSLRDETGISVMQCKKALEEAGGDIDKARVILRKASAAIAAKKSDRTLASGTAAAYVHAGGTVVGAVVLGCETDFVAKNEDFAKMARDIAMHVAAMKPQFITRDAVKEEDIAAARSVFEKEAEKVPEEKRPMVVQGKLDSYLKEKVLLDQPFVKNGDITVAELISQGVQKFGEKIEIMRMERLAV
jgi:elongation factor Ts